MPVRRPLGAHVGHSIGLVGFAKSVVRSFAILPNRTDLGPEATESARTAPASLGRRSQKARRPAALFEVAGKLDATLDV